jgi:hypothetical protein
MNTQISFQPDGTAQCLWTEVLPLHELGLLHITRASDIEFNNSTQHWEVKGKRHARCPMTYFGPEVVKVRDTML